VRRVALFLLVAAILAESWLSPPPLRMGARFFILLFCQIYPASLLFHWLVRDIAIGASRVSLVQTGRGMGAIFGGLMTMWYLLNITSNYHPVALNNLSSQQFVIFIFVSSFMTSILALFIPYSLGLLGRLTNRQQQGYSLLFYATFLFWCILITALFLLFPYNRMIDFPTT
jgi:hypothetical protein